MGDIEDRFMKEAKERVDLFESMGAIMQSNHGENFKILMSALIDGFAQTGLFAKNNDQRMEMRGAVVALQALLYQMKEYAQMNADIGEEDVRVADLTPQYASTPGDDEDL